ncbi:LacI family DNA-binding transcriptional regulator [Serinicoccus profundi]|uniref:LacI family DNA-binding transcriptional regulator n=1 Tax=Serinicoccus profundi TaxID=1078471 RepID=UPI000255E7C3|nr:LacI family DNA-binding transcriptional regulator [Serinicoccus profundi]
MATIRDVAARAGVSLATASRALTGGGPASAATVEAVRRAATELGYEVNKAARSLRTQRTDTIGLLISDVRNPFFSDLAYAVEQRAAARGLAVITMNADERPERQVDALRALTTQRVDGLIVVPQGGAPVEVPEELPLVLLDRRVENHHAPVVRSDDAMGSRQMIEHLLDLGHRDIALIAGPQSSSTGRARRAASLAALAERGAPVPEEWVVEGDFREGSGYRAARSLLAGDRRPTAIFAGDSLMAVGALTAAKEAGLRIGHDIAVVSFDDSLWFPLLDPPVTAVAQDVPALGCAAVDGLLARIAGEPVDDVVVPTRLVVRQSCRTTATTPSEAS